MKKLFIVFFLLVTSVLYAQTYKAGTDYTFSVSDTDLVYLTHKGVKINDTSVTNNQAKVHLPFDLPTGDYSIESSNGEKIKSFFVEGLTPAPVKRTVNISNLSLNFENNIIAGSKIKGSFLANFNNSSSEYLIMIFEKSKNVSYFGTSVAVNPTKNKNGFEIIIPKTMPKGDYKVYFMTDKDVVDEIPFININIKSDYTTETTDLKPIAYGFFKDITNAIQIWYTNQSYTLFWGGVPQLHISGMLNGPYMTRDTGIDGWEKFKKNIDSLIAHNIKHVYLYTQTSMRQRPLYTWETMMDYLESKGFTYTIGNPVGNYDLINKEFSGWLIRANYDKMKLIKDPKDGDIITVSNKDIYFTDIPLYKVYTVILDKKGQFIDVREAEIIEKEDTKESQIKINLKNITEPCDISVLINGNFGQVDYLMNYWEAKNRMTDYIQSEIKSIGFRPGFRGYVDLIMPNERGIHFGTETVFFDEKAFTEDRIKLLKEKYTSFENLKKSWKVKGDFVTGFEEAAILFPIYNDKKEIILSDRNMKNFYKTEADSPFWTEYLEMRDMSYLSLQNDMIDEAKKKVDVPVIVKEIVSGKKYNVNHNKNRKGFDASGFELYNSEDALMNYGLGYRYGEMLSSDKAIFAAATEINKTATETMYPNYPDIHSFFYDMSLCHLFGSKLTYLFLLDLDSMNTDHELFPHNRSLRDQRMLEWINIWENIINDKKEKIENLKPYVYNSWPQADCTWPEVSEREAVKEPDDAYGCQIIKAPNDVWVVNTQKANVGCDITFVTLNDNPGTTFYKKEFEELLKVKNHQTVMLGLRKNLGELSVDKFYKNEFFEDEEFIYQTLNVPKGAEIIKKTDGKVWAMKVGNIQIISCIAKYCNTAEDSIQFAKLPIVKNKTINAKSYAENILGIKFATYGNNHYKTIEYTVNNKNCVTLQTTIKEDKDVLKFTAPRDFVSEQYVDTPDTLSFKAENAPIDYVYPSLKKVTKSYKKGETVEIIFPVSDPNDENIGAGKGSVTFIGLSLNEIKFENITKDSFISKEKDAFGVNGLTEGLTLPKTSKITDPGMSHIEALKAMTAHNRAMDLMERGKYQKALELLREFQGCAQPKMLESYYLLLGICELYLGYPHDAISYFNDLLKKNPNSKKAKCALGCAYWNIDKNKAISLWKEANTAEAMANLEFAEK